MKILAKNAAAVIKGLSEGQLPKFFENLSQQLNFPLNLQRLKTGVIEGHILGIDDAGRFIATKGTRLQNGDIATISRFGVRIGHASKVVPALTSTTERGLLENLASQLKRTGHNMNVSRMKTGNVANKPFAIDDAGNYIYASTIERIPNGMGTISSYGKVERACSKVVPQNALRTINIGNI